MWYVVAKKEANLNKGQKIRDLISRKSDENGSFALFIYKQRKYVSAWLSDMCPLACQHFFTP